VGCGGISATKATEPGQLMTRLAVLPPTILLCCIFFYRDYNNGVGQFKNILNAVKLRVRGNVSDVIEDDLHNLGTTEL
jgi:hypothetical protein